jgi:Lipoprotein LpqB beta-propeller domain/Sporulation and spore germination
VTFRRWTTSRAAPWSATRGSATPWSATRRSAESRLARPLRRVRTGRVRATAVVVAVAAMLAGSGCAVVPRGGPVVVRDAVERRGPFDDPYLRIIPQGPQHGWAPTRIVEGFLDASASFEGGHQVARQYLAPRLRGQWRPSSVEVYDELSVNLLPALPGDVTVVAVTGQRVARIDSYGQYIAERPGTPVKVTLKIRKYGGEYRIAELPPELRHGLLLGRSDVQRAYRALNLYFFEPELRVLVPDPVYMPLRNRGDLPTALVSRLIAGPTRWLGPAVRSSFPTGTRLRSPVTVDGAGVATVDLSGEATRATVAERARQSAQLMWTLRQFPEVEAMRLLISGEPVEVLGVRGDGNQTRQNWAANGPDGLAGKSRGFFLRDGRLLELDASDPTQEARPVRPDRINLRRPAVSLVRQYLAGLSTAGDALLAGPMIRGPLEERLRVSTDGATFTAPSWDRYGNLWTAEVSDKGSAVWMLQGGQRAVRVDIPPDVADHRINALRVARDGARLAISVDSGKHSLVQLGRIERGPGNVTVRDFLPLGAELDHVGDLAWYDANWIAVIATDQESARAVYLIPVNGGAPTPRQGLGEPHTIAAAPDSPLLIGARYDGEDNICYIREEFSSWQCEKDPSSDPAYPG